MLWRLKVLGDATLAGGELAFRPERKTAAVLSYLALEGPTPRSKLAGLLWPDAEEATARNNLAQLIRRLKKATGAALLSGSEVLSLSGLEVDAARLSVLAFAGGEALLEPAGELLAVYDYDDCPDFSDWLLAERERLRLRQVQALGDAAQRCEAQGEYAEALRYAAARLKLDALSEEAHRQLMRLHFLNGDSGAALRAFEGCKALLARELGVAPSRATCELAADIASGALRPAAPVAKPPLPLRLLNPPLVGREALWEQLQAAWDNAQAVILRGEPGVGKSRLMREFVAAHGGHLAVGGRPGDSGVPYSTQSRLLRQLLASYEVPLVPWQRGELARLLPELGEAPPPLASATDELRFYEAQVAVFAGAQARGLSALAIDDLQFFDAASLRALHAILNRHWGEPGGLRLILAYRRFELAAEAEALLESAVAAGASVLFELAPLDEAQLGCLLEQLDIAPLLPFKATLHRYSGGNPLFAIETLKSAYESGATSLKLPRSSKVHALLKRRLAQRKPAALRLAWIAAVAGGELSLELAAAITQQSPLELGAAFAELTQRGIFVGQRFSHDLIFETALEDIPVPVKVYLHAQLATWLEARQAPAARVAQHWLAAGEQARALPFLKAAAEAARRDFQLVDAAGFVETMVDILEAQGNTAEAFDYLSRAREWLVNSNQYATVERILARMMALAQSEAQRGESYFARAEYLTHQRGEFARAEAAAREGLAHAPPPPQRALLLGALGDALFFQHRLAESVTVLREAAQLLEELKSDSLATTLANLALPLQYLGEYREALALQQQAIALLRQTSGHDQLSVGLCNYAITLCELGRIQDSLAPLEEALALQHTMQGVDMRMAATRLLLGQSYRDLCRFNEALSAITSAAELSEQSGDYMLGHFQASLAHIYLLLGEPGIAKAYLDKAVQALPDYPTVRARVYRELGRWQLAQGDDDAALATFARAKAALAQHQGGFILDAIQLLEAVALPPQASLELASGVLARAQEGELKGGMALAALTRCAQASLRLARPAQALDYARQAVAMLARYDPDGLYLGEVHLTHYWALVAGGDPTAKAYLQRTLDWLMDIAEQHTPADYRQSFLAGNPVNQAIVQAAQLEGLVIGQSR
jgi:DNA-binding SARP family transcriptional activator